MDSRHQDFINNFGGTVNIVTEDRILFQGQIIREHEECRKHFQPFQNNVLSVNGFILLELRCEPAIIRDNAEIKTINPPLYEQGDIIRIRVAEVVSIGPGTGCVSQTSDTD